MVQNKQSSILIVDDTPENLELLTGMLKQSGYRVRAALNGKLALQSARNEPPDLILLDITMSDMDGFEVCTILKKDKTLQKIPVIFISALNETLDKLKAFSTGGVDYITKPFQMEEVLARVKTHLQLTHIESLKREVEERKQAEAKLNRSLDEKEKLISELYHRTKNTLQVFISMLLLQANEFPENQELKGVVKKTEQRIRAISLVHQMLYKSKNLSLISIDEYLQKLADTVLESFTFPDGKVSVNIAVQNQNFLFDTAIPLGLIVNELMTNSLKHAFPDNRKGEIIISLKKENSVNKFEYGDNGIGVPEGFDFRAHGSMGLKLIHNIGELQMTGSIIMTNNSGVSCSFEFPDNLYMERV
ncbi:MAG TPA: response regulator [Spirochaetota bacterium]|nr:response regulator [Spirochaetota bacterium]